MLLNYDMIEVISDVEILGYIKKDDWPEVVHSFDCIASADPSRVCKLSSQIEKDTKNGNPKIALWFAINYPDLTPYSYVTDISLLLLYNNGFITDFKRVPPIVYTAINRKEISFDTLAIIGSNDPARYSKMIDAAILSDRVEVIKWVYTVNPSSVYMSLDRLIIGNACVEIMDFYESIYPDWLINAREIVVHKIQTYGYNSALKWLIAKIGFDIKPLLIANDGELIQNLLNCVVNYSVNIDLILHDFNDVIKNLSPGRLDAIVSMMYSKNNPYYFSKFMKAIPNAKLSAYLVMGKMYNLDLVKELYESGRISDPIMDDSICLPADTCL